MSSVQMNVRIGRDLKESGDAAFAEIGFTPTEVVREVWGFAHRNRGNRRALTDFARSLRDPKEVAAEEASRAELQEAADEWLERGPRIIREHFARHGADYDSQPALSHEDYEQLLEASYAEKHPGLWSA